MKKLFAWICVLLWAGLIFFMSSRPAITASTDTLRDFIIKKIAHIVEYSVLAGLMLRANHVTFKNNSSKTLFWTWIVIVCYAISDEIHQSFVPTRQPRLRDVVIDSTAAAVTIQSFKHIFNYYRIKTIKTIG